MTSKIKINDGGLFGLGNEKIEKEIVSPTSESATEIVSQKDYKNELTITRRNVNEYTIPMTYRLKAVTIEKIRAQAKSADMYINEYLQAVLDLVLDKIEIK